MQYFFLRFGVIFPISALLVLFLGCTAQIKDGPPRYYVDVSKIPNAKPKLLPHSKYGNPSSYVINGTRYRVLKSTRGYIKYGIASWYGTKFHGQLTSTREPYNMLAMTGASPVLPIPCFVQVTNLSNRRSVIVKINDRGPFAPHRIIDLSYVAAKKLGYANKGTAFVEVKAIDIYRRTPIRIMFTKLIIHMSYFFHSSYLLLQLWAFRQASYFESLKRKFSTYIRKPVLILKTICHQIDNQLPIYQVQIEFLTSASDCDCLYI